MIGEIWVKVCILVNAPVEISDMGTQLTGKRGRLSIDSDVEDSIFGILAIPVHK